MENRTKWIKTGGLEAAHKLLLEIAKAFHQICVDNHIPYYMLGGTQLGAIRHKGFIPWDDDMDFGVPREHFDRLIALLNEQLPPHMRVLTLHDSAIETGAIKVEYLGTHMMTEAGISFYGVFIDVFPLDYTNGNVGFFSENKLIYFMVKYNVFAFIKDKSAYKNSWLKSCLIEVLSAWKPFKKETMPALIAKMSLRHKNHFTAYANHWGFWTLREVVAKRIFGKPTLYDFESTQFFGVEHPGEYLTHLYGDYMQIPPIEKRHVHCTGVWIKNNDKK